MLRSGFCAKAIAFVLALNLISGCSSARVSDTEADRLFRQGHYAEAADHLRKGFEKEGEGGRDVLLYALDLGLSLHMAGQYEESNKVFLKTEKLAEIKDYTSLATEASTVLVSDNIKDYKAEDFENVLINTYLAMNYAILGKLEDAEIEARKVNRKIEMMVTLGQRKYKQSAFARYLTGILFEAGLDFNNAYVSYKQARDLNPDIPGLGRDLWRSAWLLQMSDETARWDEEYHLTEADHRAAAENLPKAQNGEVIVLYQNGISPIKKPNPQWHSLPHFVPRNNPVHEAVVAMNGDIKGHTAMLENIEATAIENLEEKYGGMVAKKVGGAVAKVAVGYGVAKATDSPLLGYLASKILFEADQADLRSWNLLPQNLQILRIVVPPGTYTVEVRPVGSVPLPSQTVQVGKGQKVFVTERYTPPG